MATNTSPGMSYGHKYNTDTQSYRAYSRHHGKIAITVQHSPFERRSALNVRGNDVHRFLATQPAGQPLSEQTVSDRIGYSLLNDWNAVYGMSAIGKILPSDRNVVLLAALDVKRRFEKAADWLNS